MTTRDQRLAQAAQALDCPMDVEIAPGGSYRPVVRDERMLYVSGQLPRLNGAMASLGPVAPASAAPAAGTATLEQARRAARISALRSLLLVQRTLGSLEPVQRICRMTVYVHCTSDFTQHSEVADGASELLVEVLGDIGLPARSAIGVAQLPKNASVEVELTASAHFAL
ncbi:RidA family protein [Comamonas terrigena]|jgi:enamine deaminase RidA (YjgF/YER057c/UK114 family)|uniref:RidA family protein n=1 Tax=Comamonas terrigena TaxID=32013 RepID=UPI00244C601E|nr:RidA family protein [Comamonas terrigena]MDH1292992.1 RidA family protein [Comamonas terrigena]